MVMRAKPKHESSRNLLPYFLDCMAWKKYEECVVNNYAHWTSEDPIRARRMYAAGSEKRKGYTVQEYLYDIMDCIYKSKFARTTKIRLYAELDAAERWHEEMDTILDEM